MTNTSKTRFNMISAYKPHAPTTNSAEYQKLLSSLKKNNPKSLDYRKTKVRFDVPPISDTIGSQKLMASPT
jgi:hypothetical protein